MRLAFIIPNLMPYGGNSATVTKYIQGASKSGNEIILFQSYKFSTREEYPLNLLATIQGVKITTLKFPWYKIVESTRGIPYGYVLHYLLFPFFVLFRKWLNRRIIKDSGSLDGIYSFDFVDTGLFPHSSIPLVIGTHNQRMSYLKVKAINFGLLLRRANGIRLFPSEAHFLPLLKSKSVRVISKGVDTDSFFPRKDTMNEKIKFLYVSRLEPKKGLEILLDAWRSSHVEQQAELHIVGSGPLSHLIPNSGAEGIIYHGPLYDENIQRLYRSCDVFVFPTEWDAQPTVIVEAISSGLQVLCSESMSGVFDDFNEHGWLEYIPVNSQSFAERIRATSESFQSDFPEREKMHAFVEEHRSQKTEISKILQFFDDLKKQSK